MKKLVFSLICLNATMVAFAGVIVTKNEGNIEDVSNIVVSSTEVSFMENGNSKSLPIDQVSAVLYDDGRYEEVKAISQPMQETTSYSTNTPEQVVPSTTSSTPSYSLGDDVKEISVFAFGKQIMNFYVADHQYDGANVEYRIVSKDPSVENTDWIYLGTTPFAFVTEKSRELISKAPGLYVGAVNIMQVNPLIIVGLGAKNASKVNVVFRITKDGYKPLEVTPIRKVDFSGIFIYLPLNKLKAL